VLDKTDKLNVLDKNEFFVKEVWDNNHLKIPGDEEIS
jgi:hypothetical protein